MFSKQKYKHFIFLWLQPVSRKCPVNILRENQYTWVQKHLCGQTQSMWWNVWSNVCLKCWFSAWLKKGFNPKHLFFVTVKPVQWIQLTVQQRLPKAEYLFWLLSRGSLYSLNLLDYSSIYLDFWKVDQSLSTFLMEVK